MTSQYSNHRQWRRSIRTIGDTARYRDCWWYNTLSRTAGL